ncbi:MAG: ATP-binding protein [Candidatus Omnitrophota bacterium]|jgi:serine/threonine-protein kinase RsbW
MNKTIIIESDLDRIKQVVDQVRSMLEQAGARESDVFDIRLCLEEALINAIKYGNKFDKEKNVRVDFDYRDSRIFLSVEDSGNGFDIGSVPDPTLDENILKGGGRGVFLIRYLMDELKFNKRGNRITMVKSLKQQ